MNADAIGLDDELGAVAVEFYLVNPFAALWRLHHERRLHRRHKSQPAIRLLRTNYSKHIPADSIARAGFGSIRDGSFRNGTIYGRAALIGEFNGGFANVHHRQHYRHFLVQG